MSLLRTTILLSFLTGILLVIGYFLAGISGMTIFLGIASIINFVSYWYSDRIVLALYRAKPLLESEEPELYKRVEQLAKQANIPKPKLYLVNLPVPNAFATGRNPKHGTIALTSALLKNLNQDEIEGVIAHELSHIKNRDTLVSVIAASIAGAIAYIAQIAWWGLFLGERRRGNFILFPLIILAPLAATLVRLAISRTREYAADKTGALISRKPLSLASALEKISKFVTQYPLRGNAATSHLFIVNPFKKDTFINLFSTHPPISERIKRLKEIAKEISSFR
jgi:heat shock protein HtpX